MNHIIIVEPVLNRPPSTELDAELLRRMMTPRFEPLRVIAKRSGLSTARAEECVSDLLVHNHVELKAKLRGMRLSDPWLRLLPGPQSDDLREQYKAALRAALATEEDERRKK